MQTKAFASTYFGLRALLVRISLHDCASAQCCNACLASVLAAGTPDYMSPQLTGAKTGEQGKVFYDGTKADVWAMGVLLCVILIGKFPFEVRQLCRSHALVVHM